MDNGASSYRRFLEGDESAFDEIMKELFDGLVFFIDRYVHDIHAAEDIAIDAFITCILILIAASGQCNKCISVLRYGSAFKTRLGTKLSYLLGRQLRVIHFPCGTRHKPGYQLYAECALRCQIIQSRMLVIIVLRSIPYERSEH